MGLKNKKSLGQHWLKDRSVLGYIADCAQISQSDTVLEIGPGLGTLTSELLKKAKKVVAVEYDSELARKLPGQFPGKNLEVVAGDILEFDLSQLPEDYIVVANVPYYITSKIVHTLMTAQNKPSLVVLLVQKEVAQRLAANCGEMSILSISAQVYAEVKLGNIVPADMFTPPPKVDSQIVVFSIRHKPLVEFNEIDNFFRVVRAGFSAKRKKLRSSISGGLKLSKLEAEQIIIKADINPDVRAESLSIDDWIRLTNIVYSVTI